MIAVGAYLAERAAQFGIPAYAAAVVSKGEVDLASGGAISTGSGEPVTIDTPFHLCSCSKAFTALALASLVDDSLTDWDAPVGAIVPEFQLADAWISRHATLRDLAGMRTGLERAGIAEWGFRPDAPMIERLSRAKFMALEAPFRDRFTYSNLGYVALAVAAERISGEAFEHCLRRRVFQPLNLKAASLQAGPAAASPHLPLGGVMTPVPELTGASSQGSARVHLCAKDAAHFIDALLFASIQARAGESEGRAQVFACQSLMRPPVRTVTGLSSWGYGFGWILADYKNRPVFVHGGGGRGLGAFMIVDPNERAGVMVMMAHEGGVADGLALALLDLATGVAPKPLSRLEPPPAAPRPQSSDPANIGAQVGLYVGDVTGKVSISRSHGNDLRFAAEDAPVFDARLEEDEGGLFKFVFDNPAMTPMPGDPFFRHGFHENPRDGVYAQADYFGRLQKVDR
jgi:CubicO group peptidase (beta-lactamase class C family)